MTEGPRLSIVVIVGLVPWGVVAIVTNWYNEVQSDGTQTLSVPHALLLCALQLGLGFGAYWVLDRWRS